MKKNYVSPLTEEVNVETTQMLANSIPTDGNTNIDTNNPDTPQHSNDRRGDWGNLWN